MGEPETYVFDGDGRFPNSRLPALVYRGALPADVDAMTRAFAANGWSNAWVDGIFPYHHFHSITHEVLGIASGEVQVALGGPGGRTLTLEAGVLIVEDEPEMRELIRGALEKHGWKVTEAANGAEGLALVDRSVPHVVLLDLNMPVMDGFAFLRELRTRPRCLDVPVVVLTARDLSVEDRRALRGANQVLHKGETRMADLVRKLQQLGMEEAA